MSIKTSILKPVSAALAVALLSSSVAFAQATAPAPTTAPKAPVTAPAAPVAPKAPAAPAVAAPAAKAAAPATAVAPKAQLVNLNTATAEQLDGLPQIGAARAKAIVEARAKGKFKNWDDFVARNVVPANAEAAIKDKVTF
ncbi:MAG: helix-hairpin-helix domain-containing protein [Beijerinckiaceae bacterium]|nr:helix-hairpin-helix domain-containing protein [Beijerinckiaceae bacterium]